MDRTNLRLLELVPGPPPSLVTLDLAFISLRLVLGRVAALATPGAEVVALFKPQFELGRGAVERGGVVRDRAAGEAGAVELIAWAAAEPRRRRPRPDPLADHRRPGEPGVARPPPPPRRRRGGATMSGTGRSVGFLLHPRERHHRELLDAAIAVVERAGLGVWRAMGDAETALTEHAATTALLVTVGGDGTFLLGARLAAPRGSRCSGSTVASSASSPTSDVDRAPRGARLLRRAAATGSNAAHCSSSTSPSGEATAPATSRSTRWW